MCLCIFSAESDLKNKKQSKRGLVALSDGSIIDDSILDGESFEQSLLNGLAGLGENIPVQNIQKEKVKSHKMIYFQYYESRILYRN